MIYRELVLPEPLRRIALCAWRFQLEPGDPPLIQHQVPPDGTTGLTLIRTSAGEWRGVLVGPMLTAFTVPVMQGFAYAGLRLRPEMARPLTGADPEPGALEPVESDGRCAAILADLSDLLDGGTAWDHLLALADAVPEGDGAIAAAVDRLTASGGTVPVSRLAALAQLSERQFRRRFHAATGITPKQYADVQRTRRALILALEDPDWAGIAHDSGFADQPHLVRDVKLRFGAAPMRVSGYYGGIRHELLDGGGVRNIQEDRAQAA